jgi:hydrogenase maturation factor
MPGDIVFEGKVLRIREDEDEKNGWVDLHGVRIRVNLSRVPDVREGDRVLVQGRTALSRIETPA